MCCVLCVVWVLCFVLFDVCLLFLVRVWFVVWGLVVCGKLLLLVAFMCVVRCLLFVSWCPLIGDCCVVIVVCCALFVVCCC